MYEDTFGQILHGANNSKDQGLLEIDSSLRPDKKERRALIKLKKASNYFKK